ncbi:MAG: DUF177 domain-containing protein [Candidatus Fermentibacteraceae bacterium]
MIIDTKKLSLAVNSLDSGKRSSGVYTIPLGDLDWNIPEVEPMPSPGELCLEVTMSGDSILVEGTFSALFTAPCSRCLEPALIEVKGEVRRMYSSDPALEDEPDVEPVSHHDGWISIFDAVRESVILSIPMVPLCDKGCRGLCSVCGANLNKDMDKDRGDCGHLVGE